MSTQVQEAKTPQTQTGLTDPKDVKVIVEKATYSVPQYGITDKGLICTGYIDLKFAKGNIADPTALRQEGFFTETLLQVALTYLKENNVGDLENRDTTIAVESIETALLRLQKRSEDRKKRQVQGTYQK